MKKQQTNLFILTAIIFIFMAGKYIFIPAIIPVPFFMFELISAMTFLFLIYYTDRSLKKMKEKESELTDDNQSLNRTIEHLKNELEKKNNTSAKEFSTGNTIKNIDTLFQNLKATQNSREFYDNILTALSENFEIVIALFFIYDEQTQNFSVEGNYGILKDEPVAPFSIGEGVHGEALKEKKPIVLKDLPEEYFVGYSGLGESKPKHLYVLPVANDEKTVGVIEIASYKSLSIDKVWDKVNKKLIDLITAI